MIKKKVFYSLIALGIGIILSSSVVSSDPRPQWEAVTLAIEVRSSATRLSIVDEKGQPRIIYTGPGVHSTHELLQSDWTDDDFLLVKDDTDKSLYIHPYNTLFNLGHPVSLRSRYEYNNRPDILGHRPFTLIDITAEYLQNLIAFAESTLRHNIDNIAIISPDGLNVRTIAKKAINHRTNRNYTYYDTVFVGENGLGWDSTAMRKAFDAAGIHVKMYRRSDAAIFPFGHGMTYGQGLLVYHLGSSTFEVSVHKADGSADKVDGPSSEMLSSVFHRHFGGDDFNDRIIDDLLQTYNTKSGQEPVHNDIFLHRMEIEVEKAKRLLSTQDSVQIHVKHPDSGGQDLSEQLTRSQFEDLNMDLFTKTLMSIDQALKDSVVFTKDDIQDVFFSGGSANIPFLQSAIQQYFGADKNYHGLVEPETTVVLGAAKSYHWRQDNSYYSCCTGEYGRMFGIGIRGGAMFRFSDPASHLNTNKMFTFTTTMDNQDRIVIGVFSGSGERTNQNSFWGGVELVGIAPAPKGVPQIRVRISTNHCGTVVYLKVMDMASGRVNGTIIYGPDDGPGYLLQRAAYEQRGVFEIEPAGKMVHVKWPDHRYFIVNYQAKIFESGQ